MDHEGEVLESYVTRTRDKVAALRFMRKANPNNEEIGRYANRAKNSHLPIRRRVLAILRFRQMRSLHKFALVNTSQHNHFAEDHHLVDRST